MERKDEYYKDEFFFLGKEVTVCIDRPLHSLHPDHGFRYELNYGYIPNTKAGDGEEIDAYVIGENAPIQQFKGLVKGIIIRLNDNENKLVVTSANYPISEAEIREKTCFQEQFFETKIQII